MLIVWEEFRIAEGVFKPGRVNRSAADLKVNLDVDVCGARVAGVGMGAKKSRHQAAEQDEFGPPAVVVDDTHEG
jgi:hypothetical protein